MAPNVLLINPPIYDFAAYDLFARPLGLLYLASWLRQAGYRVRLLDALDRNHPLTLGRPDRPRTRANGTGKYISTPIETPYPLRHIPRIYRCYGLNDYLLNHAFRTEPEPDAILVTSMMTYWYPAVADTIRLARAAFPSVPIGLGGIYATLLPEHARRLCRPDRLFTGHAFHDALAWLDNLTGRSRPEMPPAELPHWPTPAYDLYPRLDAASLVTSLGCPFRCEYCATGVLQPTRQHLPAAIAADHLADIAPRVRPLGHPPAANIAFMDDALLANADRHLLPLLERLRRLKTPVRFHTPNGLHCRYVTPELARALHDADFAMVRLSYESADAAPRWLAASDHKTSDRDLAAAVENLRSAGYPAHQLEAYILTGLPGQTLAEARTSAQAVFKLGLRARLCRYTPIPHTPLFETACREYGVDPDEPLLHNNSILPALAGPDAHAEFKAFRDWVHQSNHRLSQS